MKHTSEKTYPFKLQAHYYLYQCYNFAEISTHIKSFSSGEDKPKIVVLPLHIGFSESIEWTVLSQNIKTSCVSDAADHKCGTILEETGQNFPIHGWAYSSNVCRHAYTKDGIAVNEDESSHSN